MFKMFEKKQPMSYRLDMDSTGVSTIEPGSILYNGANGLRLATTGDTARVDNAGLFFVSNDYYSNSGMGNIYGHNNAMPGFITALPLVDPAEIEIDYSGAASAGDLFGIHNGVIVKIGNTTYSPIQVLYIALDGKSPEGTVLLGNVSHTYENQPTLYIPTGGEAGMVEGGSTCTLTVGIRGAYAPSEVIDAANWEITGIEELFDVAAPEDITISVALASGAANDTAIITFTSAAEISLSSGQALAIVAKRAAILNGREDTEAYDYTYAPAAVLVELAVEDDSGMVVATGTSTGTLVLSLVTGTFDEVRAEDNDNWSIDATGIGVPEGEFTVTVAAGGATATIAFDTGGADMTYGRVTILAHAAAIAGLYDGDTELLTYTLAQTTLSVADDDLMVDGSTSCSMIVELSSGAFIPAEVVNVANWTIDGIAGMFADEPTFTVAVVDGHANQAQIIFDSAPLNIEFVGGKSILITAEYAALTGCHGDTEALTYNYEQPQLASATTVTGGDESVVLAITLAGNMFADEAIVENEDNWTIDLAGTGLSAPVVTRTSDVAGTISFTVAAGGAIAGETISITAKAACFVMGPHTSSHTLTKVIATP